MVESFFMKYFLKVNDDKLSQQYISAFSLSAKNLKLCGKKATSDWLTQNTGFATIETC